MPAGVVKTGRDEHLWTTAKQQAAKAGRAKDYAYIMGIFKKMKGDVEKAEQLRGGEGDDRPDSAFHASALQAGMRVEREHSTDPRVAKEIAKDHLTEDPKYYEKLKRVEKADEEPAAPGEHKFRLPTAKVSSATPRVPKPPAARQSVEKAMDPLIKSVLTGKLTLSEALRELPGAQQVGMLRDLRKAKQQGLFGDHPSMRGVRGPKAEQMGLFGGGEGGGAGTGGKGAGSRGGHVIGTYPDGSPRYADKPAAKPYGKHPTAGTEGPPQSHGEGWEPVHGSKEGGWKRKGEVVGKTPDDKPVHHVDHWFPGGKEKQPSLFGKGEPSADELEKKYMGTWTPSGIQPGKTGAAPAGMKPGEAKPLGKTPEESEAHAKRLGLPSATGEPEPKKEQPVSRGETPERQSTLAARHGERYTGTGGKGEGSRGGQVSGHSASGKPIYGGKAGAAKPPPVPGAPKPPPIPGTTAKSLAGAILRGEETLSKAFSGLGPMDQLGLLRELRLVKAEQLGLFGGAPAAAPAKPAAGGAWKAPQGYEPVPGSKHGGFRKREGAGYVYAYPGTNAKTPHVADLETHHRAMAELHGSASTSTFGDHSERQAAKAAHEHAAVMHALDPDGQSTAARKASSRAAAADRKVKASAKQREAIGPAEPPAAPSRPEGNDEREIREMRESAMPAEHHGNRAVELRDMARRFSATDPKEDKHHWALRSAMDEHRVAWERGQGEDAGTYDADSHSHDAQEFEKRPEVEAALAEVARRDRNLKTTDMSSRRSYPAKGKAKPKDPTQAHHAEAAKLAPQRPGEGAKKLDHEMAHRHAFQYHSEQSRAARGRSDSDAEVAHAQAAEAHSTAGNSWSYVRDSRHADSTRAFNLTDIAGGKPGAAEAAAHREKAIAHREKANYHDNHARYATAEGYNAGDSHRRAAEKHELAAKTGDGEHRYQADAASREAEQESALAEHSYRLQDHASKGEAHMKAHEFHKKMADQNRVEAQRLRRNNPDSPKAKKAFDRQAAHQEAADAHMQASAHHWDARDKLREWAHPKSRSKWEGHAKGAEEFSTLAHKRSEDAYGQSAKLGLSPGDFKKSMQPGAKNPPGKDPLMKKDTSKGPMREDELRKKGQAAQKGKPQPGQQQGQQGQQQGQQGQQLEGQDPDAPQPGSADYHKEQAMKHLAAAQAHANAHHSAKKIAETGDHDEKVKAADEASAQAIVKKGGMMIDLGAEADVLSYLEGGGQVGSDFATLPDPRGVQRLAALRGGIMQKAEKGGHELSPGGGVAGGPVYQGEWDQQGSRGGDMRESTMRLKEQLMTVEDDPAGSRGQGGLDEWWRDAYGKAQGIETDVNVPVGPMSMVRKSEEPPIQIINDDDPYTRAVYRADPRDGAAGIRMAYQGGDRDKERRGQ